jgi:hypothetical protein
LKSASIPGTICPVREAKPNCFEGAVVQISLPEGLMLKISEVSNSKYLVILYTIWKTMSLTFGTDIFSLPPGGTFNLTTVFNSNSLTRGGDYKGPMVVAGVPTPQSHHRVLTPSTVSLEFTQREDSFSSFCIYHYSIKNDSAHSVSFVIHLFYD